MSITLARSFVVLKARFGSTEGLTPCVSNTTPNVVPSGAAWATAPAPIEPEAPGRFSTMNCWPSAVVSSAARMRATWSVEPPGGKPTMNFTVFDGQAWAWANWRRDGEEERRGERGQGSGHAHGDLSG